MEVADRPASGSLVAYADWCRVQKTSVLSYYSQLVKQSEKYPGYKKGQLNTDNLTEKTNNYLNEHVAVTIIELEKLMSRYEDNNVIFSMSITSIVDKLIHDFTQSHTRFIPFVLRKHLYFLCHILLLEHFNHTTSKKNALLQRALDCMKSTLYHRSHGDYLFDNGGGLHLILDDVVHSLALQCDVNPYVI